MQLTARVAKVVVEYIPDAVFLDNSGLYNDVME